METVQSTICLRCSTDDALVPHFYHYLGTMLTVYSFPDPFLMKPVEDVSLALIGLQHPFFKPTRLIDDAQQLFQINYLSFLEEPNSSLVHWTSLFSSLANILRWRSSYFLDTITAVLKVTSKHLINIEKDEGAETGRICVCSIVIAVRPAYP